MIRLGVSVAVALTVSAFCSLCEAVLYSVPHTHVELLASSGRAAGRRLRRLKANIQDPITAILTLNTVANTMGAAVAGASAAALFGDRYLSLFSAVFTLAVLLVAEIIPKTAGVIYCRRLAPVLALPVGWLVRLLAPIIWLCRAVTGLFGSQGRELLVSAEEIEVIAAMSLKAGTIAPTQEKVIHNILRLDEIPVRDAMTPRTVTFSLSEHLTVGAARERLLDLRRHSRVPVYDADPDDVVGIVLAKDILAACAQDHEDTILTSLMQPVHFVPEAASLDRVLVEFLERRQHLFVVVDEYGSFTGVISLEDVLEEIVGREIVDESDQTRDMRDLARRQRRILTGQGAAG
ncbi:MAG: hemolysin family protein [Thermodesulfobacteriota bacterium]